MHDVLIWGASGHAKVVADAIRQEGRLEVVGFVDDLRPGLAGRPFIGATVLGGRDALLDARDRGVTRLVIGFGHCQARLRVAEWAAQRGFDFPTVVHPAAVVSPSARLGVGTVVVAGAVVNADAVIGDQVILNTACTVDHDAIVADGAHVCPGTRLAGGVRVGRGAWVGIGSIVRENIGIGAHTMVGAGSLVLSDLPAGVLAYGSPARVQGPWPAQPARQPARSLEEDR